MSVFTLMDQLRDAGISVARDGDSLRVRGESGVSLAPYVERIRTHKPTLLAVLHLQEQIVTAASVASAAFDRAHYDRRWADWYALEAEETTQ